MFSSTAYEAFYSYIGIYLHEASIRIITSQSVLNAVMMLTLGICFIMGAWRFTKKQIPGMGGGGGIGFIFKLMACFLIGMSLLRVESDHSVNNFKRHSWHNNSYISSRLPSVEPHYKVSFIFDLLVRSAEELARFGNQVVDQLFAKTNSQLEAPDAFYRAILFAGSQTIEDPQLKDKIDVYTRSCFDKILPLLGEARVQNRMDEFFREGGAVDLELDAIPIETETGSISCLDLKDQVRSDLWDYAGKRGAKFSRYYGGKVGIGPVPYTEAHQRNLIASNALVNHYLSKSQDAQGTHKGAKVEGMLASFFLRVSRFFSFDGFLSTIGQNDSVGAALTANRAEKFSEYLQRAPHLKGIVKMFLIALFPWLVFFVVAGRWKVLISWYVVYISVLLWTPIWTLLYHLMTSIAVSTNFMEEFGRLNDGVSLYSSSFITSKIYQFYAIYSWLQLIIGPLPTLVLGYNFLASFTRDSEQETAPPVVTAAKDVGVGAATGGASGAVGAVAKRI